MGGDDLFVLILCVGFAVVSIMALRGSRGAAAPIQPGDARAGGGVDDEKGK